MTHRFYTPEPLAAAEGTVVLMGSEAHHLRNVLRLRPGSAIEVFDGLGSWAAARVETVTRHEITVTVSEVQTEQTESAAERRPLILAVASPKGDRLRWLVEKASEIGATELVPLQCEHSVVEPRAHKLDKLRQTAIASAKQCRRTRLLQISDTLTWPEFLERDAGRDACLVADPRGAPIIDVMQAGSVDTGVRCAIGPESGFTAAELEQAEARGWLRVAFPTYVLRIETAALVAAAYARLWAAGSNDARHSE